MEMELKNLIDKIKSEGVLEAEKSAAVIIKEAEEKARSIIAKAESQKSTTIKDGEAGANAFKMNSERALKQSARDVLLTLRENAAMFFDRIVKEKISGELSADVLKEAILKAAQNLKKDGISDIEVVLGEKDKARLEKTLLKAFAEEAGKQIKVTGKKGMGKGFRIGEGGKDSFFDFTDSAIAEAFTKYLNPKLVEMLDIDVGPHKDKKNV